jgi:hypothetical protein
MACVCRFPKECDGDGALHCDACDDYKSCHGCRYCEPDDEVTIMLAINDEHGNQTGRLAAVDIPGDDAGESRLHLECLDEDEQPECRIDQQLGLVIGGDSWPLASHGHMVGNVHWDSVDVTVERAAEIVNALRKHDAMTVTPLPRMRVLHDCQARSRRARPLPSLLRAQRRRVEPLRGGAEEWLTPPTQWHNVCRT